jgi:cephalosporin hydroxylase
MDEIGIDSAEFARIKQDVTDSFHSIFYGSKAYHCFWCGVPAVKNPLDMWMYQQIIADCRPDVLIETGTFMGGSALFYAMVMDRLGSGRVISVDIDIYAEGGHVRPEHERITYLLGDSGTAETAERLARWIAPGDSVMLVLDSDHSAAHVGRELDHLAALVTPGQYLVVEDTNVNGHPVFPQHGPGPHEAVEAWLPEHPEFERRTEPELYGVTFNPGGFLLRKRA